jgi:mannan endo-1,4-beta-mannosidase
MRSAMYLPSADISLTPAPARTRPLTWIQVAKDAPYFVDEEGAPFTPIGQNDAISWPDLEGLFRRKDMDAVERHLRWIKAHGVNTLRLMLEYAQVRHRYFEQPAGRFVPAMVQLWDDLFALCEKLELRILLTPVDTFWMWRHWKHLPWNKANGGPLEHMSQVLTCPATRAAIKHRFEFVIRRWGGSGALFAWDLWNEIHPAQGGEEVECWDEFVHDVSTHVRSLENELYGRSHPQTVSIFGPELVLQPHHAPAMRSTLFRHPDLDFASIHIYSAGTIDNPKDTVRPALVMGGIVTECLAHITDGRPFLDSEHGPIFSFLNKKKTLPEPFDDEYFRHLSWAHLASGGAGGGMRWPNRHPHTLTHGMRRAQKAMVDFLDQIDWANFRRRNLNGSVKARHFHAFACGDENQALVWLLRRDNIGSDKRLRRDAVPVATTLAVPGLADGRYRVCGWDTEAGALREDLIAEASGGTLQVSTGDIVTDRAYSINRA